MSDKRVVSLTSYRSRFWLPGRCLYTVSPKVIQKYLLVAYNKDTAFYFGRQRSNMWQPEDAYLFNLVILFSVPPEIQPIPSRELRQGERTQLLCIVSRGDLPIDITWLKDGQPLPTGIGITVHSLADFSSSLSILDASPVHDGSYTCEAVNQVATVNLTTNLVVLGKLRQLWYETNKAVLLWPENGGENIQILFYDILQHKIRLTCHM